LSGIQKQKDWRDHQTGGADAMKLIVVKKIFNAGVFRGDEMDYVALRNKAIAMIMIVNHCYNENRK
jgi:hypothetical protein